MLSAQALSDLDKLLDTDRPVDWRTALLPRDTCQVLVDQMDAEPKNCTLEQAGNLLNRLLRNYPDFKAKDHPNTCDAWTEILTTFRWSVGYRATGPEGLPAELSFNPKTADLKKSLDAAQARWTRIRSNALWHNQERDDRAKQEEAQLEQRIIDEENRKPDVRARRLKMLADLKAEFSETEEKLSMGRKLPRRPPPTAEELAESLKRCMAVPRME